MSWSNPPTSFKKEVRDDLFSAMKATAFRILRILIFFSPRDTGRFVTNWMVGVKRRVTRITTSTDRSGQIALNAGKATLDRASDIGPIYITNNLPYARRLNDGHSQQAPANFVQIAVDRASRS